MLLSVSHLRVCSVCTSKSEIITWLEGIKDSLIKVENTINRVLLPCLALQKSVLPSNLSPLPHQAESSASRSFHLSFKGELPETLYTNEKIEDLGASITIELCDDSGNKVESDPSSPLKVKIEVLQGDFVVEDCKNDLTVEIYQKNVVSPRKDKGPLLKGNCEVLLSGGSASLSGILFTDNSASMRNGTFRLGAKVINSGIVVKPAVSKSFMVKEGRLRADQKKEIPSLEDELWRLKNIGKTGPIYKRALEKNVHTVEDFLQLYHTDAEKMKTILGVTGKNWDAIVKNAEACKLPNKRLRYYDPASGNSLSLDCGFNIISVLLNGQMSQPFESLDDHLKEEAYKLRRTAYEKRNELTLDDFTSNQRTVPKEPGNTFSVQLQEKEQQKSGPIPTLSTSTDPNNNFLFGLEWKEIMDLTIPDEQQQPGQTLTSSTSSYSNSADLAALMDTVNLGLYEYFGGSQRRCLEDTEWNTTSPEYIQTAQMEERRNVEGSVHDHATSKLLAACYVTRAATLFMITVQEDLSAPKKKRKLQ
ncbi:calmodulin-binding protein 60 B-like isoform X2 [Amaranthus tricolor]|uniref:calmodulin-binding protein 60 B-like isoform X2 n=1 Tax=Amaranthus tricolor TaxID=29722 RepID=UPI00258D734D|nr:calmodulin-binding protein 60 B-like isoform X2 [Amaranthus tricolor]